MFELLATFTKGDAAWAIWFIILLFGGVGGVWTDGVNRRWFFGGLAFWILIGLKIWGIFGPPVH